MKEGRSQAARLRRPMALKAVITIEIQAADFIEAAELQRQLRAAVAPLQHAFPQTDMRIIERRRQKA